MKKNCQKESCFALGKKLSSCFCLRKLLWFYEVTKKSSNLTVQIILRSYLFQVNTNVVPKLFTSTVKNYERRAGKRFFSVNLQRHFMNLWICSCCEIIMKFFQNSFKMSHFSIICVKYWQLYSSLASLIFFVLRKADYVS